MSLKELNLGENQIDETGYIELFSVLNLNVSSLKVLIIDSPFRLSFGEETAYQFSKVLKNNNKIEKLSLQKLSLTDESLIIMLKEML